MEVGNPYDPLLRQVLPLEQEFEVHKGYSTDPLEEQDNAIPGLLHKYKNRVSAPTPSATCPPWQARACCANIRGGPFC
jgi:L-lysine 2,3-aminomutase